MEKYLMTPPFNRRPVTINTLCVVGACTCIMIKMAVEKAFKTLGISELDIDVQPTVEDSPRGQEQGSGYHCYSRSKGKRLSRNDAEHDCDRDPRLGKAGPDST